MERDLGYQNRIVGHGVKKASEFQAHPNNWRKHPKNQRSAVKGSLESLGWVAEVIENKTTGRLIDGHERVWNALHNGDADVPYIQVELTEAEEAQALLSLDAIAALAETDREQVNALLEQVNTDNADVMQFLTDFAKDNKLEWGQPEQGDAEPQIDRAAELLEKWKVETGDLWQIGEHRLLCGDSTKREDVERVMGGEKADMVFTDPPYNVASESRNYAADKSKAMKDLSESEWDKDFDIKTVFPNLELIMAKDCAVYVCTSQWLVQTIWEWMWSWSDFCFYCVWCKPNPMPSLSKRHWTWATELIPYAVRGKHTSNFPTDGHALNWWDIAKSKETDHPTEKVIGVPERALEFSSVIGASIFDGFAGSGTTMVACQNLNRKCRAIEILPAYCAVILERMTTAFPNIVIQKVNSIE